MTHLHITRTDVEVESMHLTFRDADDEDTVISVYAVNLGGESVPEDATDWASDGARQIQRWRIFIQSNIGPLDTFQHDVSGVSGDDVILDAVKMYVARHCRRGDETEPESTGRSRYWRP